MSSLTLALILLIAVATLAVVHSRDHDHASSTTSPHPKEISAARMLHVDVIVVPGTASAQRVLDMSPQVTHYALLSRGERPALLKGDSVLAAPLVAPVCALEAHAGFAVEASVPGSDIESVLAHNLPKGETAYDTSDPLGADFEVFMKVGAPSDSVDSVRAALAADPDVASVQFLTQTDAYKLFKTDFADQPSLVQGTNLSDLPVSFRVDVRDGKSPSAAVQRYLGRPDVDTVTTRHDGLTALFTAASSFEMEMAAALVHALPTSAEAFLTLGASTAQVEALRAALAADPNVNSVQFLSQADAYAVLMTDFADQPSLVQSTKPSDLPESFRFDVKAGKSAIATTRKYRAMGGVETVITSADALKAQAAGLEKIHALCAKP